MVQSKKPGLIGKGWGFVKGHAGAFKNAGIDEARSAWADIGTTYQNVLWSNSGVGAPNQPYPQYGPQGLQSLSMNVEVEMKFGPGHREPFVTVKKGAHVHDLNFKLPPAGPATDGSKAGRVGPPASDGPDSTINKVGPPVGAKSAATGRAGHAGPPKSVASGKINNTIEPEYEGPEIGL